MILQLQCLSQLFNLNRSQQPALDPGRFFQQGHHPHRFVRLSFDQTTLLDHHPRCSPGVPSISPGEWVQSILLHTILLQIGVDLPQTEASHHKYDLSETNLYGAVQHHLVLINVEFVLASDQDQSTVNSAIRPKDGAHKFDDSKNAQKCGNDDAAPAPSLPDGPSNSSFTKPSRYSIPPF